MQEDKIRENRLRRMAERQGLYLKKSRRRDPLALDYGAYWLIDPHTNTVVAGDDRLGISLDDVEHYLSEPRPRRAGRTQAAWAGGHGNDA
jgi:hypothetical protein